jgi:predicted hotdog family 3-hydroxylacyl-ACP dehydratase
VALAGQAFHHLAAHHAEADKSQLRHEPLLSAKNLEQTTGRLPGGQMLESIDVVEPFFFSGLQVRGPLHCDPF